MADNVMRESVFQAGEMVGNMKVKVLLLMAMLSGWAAEGVAQHDILADNNGDGIVTYVGFGDSITYGVGDGSSPGEYVVTAPATDGRGGYVPRLSGLLGIAAVNSGFPGEELVAAGVHRFPAVARGLAPDIVGVFEGSNDAIKRVGRDQISRSMQKMINVTFALGLQPVVFTLPPPCCQRQSLRPFTNSYSQAVREISLYNQIPMVDLERAWRTTCSEQNQCELYNVPEGLHPNTLGYDAIAQTTAASLLQIDIFAENGAHDLEAALGLAAGTVVVKPDLSNESDRLLFGYENEELN